MNRQPRVQFDVSVDGFGLLLAIASIPQPMSSKLWTRVAREGFPGTSDAPGAIRQEAFAGMIASGLVSWSGGEVGIDARAVAALALVEPAVRSLVWSYPSPLAAAVRFEFFGDSDVGTLAMTYPGIVRIRSGSLGSELLELGIRAAVQEAEEHLGDQPMPGEPPSTVELEDLMLKLPSVVFSASVVASDLVLEGVSWVQLHKGWFMELSEDTTASSVRLVSIEDIIAEVFKIFFESKT